VRNEIFYIIRDCFKKNHNLFGDIFESIVAFLMR